MRTVIIPLLLLFATSKSYSKKTIQHEDVSKHIGNSAAMSVN